MTTATASPAGASAARTAARLPRQRAGTHRAGLYVGIAAIVLWCLLPCYWMIVTAFRDVGFTFDTTPWPTHVTLDNFTTAFSTARGNHFGAALVHSVIIGVITTAVAMLVGVFASYALAR